jgi:putative redox protein
MSKQHFTSVKHKQGMAFEADINGFKIQMDVASDTHTPEAPSPKPFMLAALAGCTGVDIVSILDKMRVTYSDLTIDTTAQLSEGNPSIYESATVIYSIRLAEADRDKMDKAVKLSIEKYCGVWAMFQTFCQLSYEIRFTD